jgi:hypothetical protein
MTIKGFLKAMLTKSEDVSSRRVVGLLAFVVILIITFVDLFSAFTITGFIFDGLMWILLGCFGLTTVSDFKSMSVKSDVASTALENNSTPEEAQEIMESNKP